MNKKYIRIVISAVTLIVVAWTLIPLASKYLNPPKYAPKGYHVDFDSKIENATRVITLKDSGDKHTIGISQSAEDLSACNGEMRTIIETQVCWGLKLPSTNDLIITWKKNGYTYIVKTNDSLSIDDVASMISNL
ncbi:hypothetical protein CO051_00430 [Candidatus Roizmanbacteria bacterium CG_4_9_14_0_2_um_filter_39_13]|uniref:DUF4367 domain-containing protein n=1 Tax=Candidatus Roizmanbacteria bacterium CG_4_9_14_0_2_um_filter_39_13 TaxID=1974839 RepID=A0A2M8F4E4_9BACT|nr:MAG: hypothetical protein CO051_00430 [Candidatus Roizmanbacteria bacterium CG_4_9_14_0_2_um_filter_39_13]